MLQFRLKQDKKRSTKKISAWTGTAGKNRQRYILGRRGLNNRAAHLNWRQRSAPCIKMAKINSQLFICEAGDLQTFFIILRIKLVEMGSCADRWKQKDRLDV